MTAPYGAIVADPPWRFRNTRTGGSLRSGAADHYPTMSTADLCRLPVRDLAAKNSILFLWGTGAMLPDALAVVSAWGFRYKGSIVWCKTTAAGAPFNGMGAWFRNRAEYLLFGIRGTVPALRCQMPNVIAAPVRGHSEKPEEVWHLIETALSGREDLTQRLELFCRGPPRPGWDGWGNQCEGGVTLPALDTWAAALSAEAPALVTEGR